jgi:purine-nucleoside phosphorylase
MTQARHRLQNWQAEIAIILGSGLDSIVQEPIESIDYTEFSELPKPRVAGHAGKFSLCKMSGKRVLFAQGRVHLYEGYSPAEITANVRTLAQAGVAKLIVTNAAGGLNARFRPGDWMIISDHLNLTATSPLIGSAQFLDLANAYSPRLQRAFRDAGHQIGMVLRQGVYAATMGPQYETAAEVRMLQKLGADAVGMSTVLEVIQARALGMEVAGFSCVTNLASGLSSTTLSHEEVLDTGRNAAANFSQLLQAALPKL